MKAILIADILEEKQALKPLLKKHDLDLIHYRSPLKALDNIEEIAPDTVIINAMDFPRHWKILAQYIRSNMPKEEVILILLISSNFNQQDADKAVCLGIQGIIRLKDDFSLLLPKIEKVINRYKDIKQNTEKKDIFQFTQLVFTNPINGVIITGQVNDIDEKHILFIPDSPANTANLIKNTIIEKCILQVKDLETEIKCIIKSNTTALDLIFTEISQKMKNKINDA